MSIAKENAKTQIQFKVYSNYYSWLICFVASLFFFYEIIQLTVFNSISNDFIRTFSLSTSQLSRLSASYLYACALFLLPAGLLFDRFSTKKLLIVASSFCVFGTWLLTYSAHVEIAMLGRALTGIGNAFAFLGCMRLASRWFPAHKIALVMGLSVTIAMLGGIVSQTPFMLLINEMGWQQAMFINSLLGVVITLLIGFIVKDAPIKKMVIKKYYSPIKPINFWYSLKQASLNKQNILCGLYTGIMNLPVMLLGALWGNLYCIQGLGFTESEAGNITSLIFFGLIIGAPLMGWLSDKLKSRRQLMLINSILLLLIMLVIIYLPLSILAFSSLFLVMGIVSGAQVLSYPIVSENNPHSLESTSLGLVAVIVNLCGATSQLLFGWLINLKWRGLTENGIPIHALSEYQFALFMLPLAFLMSLLAAAFIKDSYSNVSCKR